jgi:hypothetical protein
MNTNDEVIVYVKNAAELQAAVKATKATGPKTIIQCGPGIYELTETLDIRNVYKLRGPLVGPAAIGLAAD